VPSAKACRCSTTKRVTPDEAVACPLAALAQLDATTTATMTAKEPSGDLMVIWLHGDEVRRVVGVAALPPFLANFGYG
jgi:hypothetical protein